MSDNAHYETVRGRRVLADPPTPLPAPTMEQIEYMAEQCNAIMRLVDQIGHFVGIEPELFSDNKKVDAKLALIVDYLEPLRDKIRALKGDA